MKRFIVLFTTATLAGGFSHAATVADCVAAALEGNPDLAASTARAEAAAAAVGEARSGWYPTVTLSGSYARTDNPPQAFFMALNQRQASLEEDFNDPDDTDNFRGSIGFKMLLADAGQRGMNIDMARLGETAAQDMLSAARNELTHQVTRAYYTVAQARAMVEVMESTLASIRENLRVARERYASGAAVKTDVLNLEVQEAEANERLIRANNQVQLAVAALNTAIGRDFITSDDIMAEPASPLPAPPESVDPGDVDHRPERSGILRQAEAASLDYTRSRRDRMPRLMGYGSMDWDSDSTSDFEDSYFVGAALEWDIFTGFRRDHASAAAKARENEAHARATALTNQLRLELEQAFLNTREAWARIEVASRSLASADEAQRITRERYGQGSADITELQYAEAGLTAARSREVLARYDYIIALSNLNRARGLNSAAITLNRSAETP